MSDPVISADELPKQYDHTQAQERWYKFWDERGYFNSDPPPFSPAAHGGPGATGSASETHRKPFCIVIPPPNVTGALHLGHALNNTLQDIVIRMKRMQGFNTLWMPGADHAGIATQAVVERRLREEENLDRHKLGREKLVERIWKWKEDYEARILGQLKQLGCSCDWRRTRFTLDEICARAVRHTFFRMFKDGLIFRGKRLVNWDTFLQTAVADDEVFHETVKGHFWHFRYPVIDPQPGEPTHVTIATTRPETMLGDTAVAVHPDPAAALDEAERDLRAKHSAATVKEKTAIEGELESLSHRRQAVLPLLLKLRDMANAGRNLMLPLADRPIPLIEDQWAKPELGSGCVKITPAHDPNDYDVWQRHKEIGAINILNPDGTLNDSVPERYRGLTVKKARAAVVADLESAGLLESIEDREIDLAHSDRSKTPIEPYLADQWFVRMGDSPDGKPGLAQMAMDAVSSPSPSGRGQGEGAGPRVKIIPSRYAKSYLDWLGEKRDWCIGRQLWWGHRVPVWEAITSSGGVVDRSYLQKELKEQEDAIDALKCYFEACAIGAEDYSIQPIESWSIRICSPTEKAHNALRALVVFHESFVPKLVKPGEPLSSVLHSVPGFEQATSAASKIRFAHFLKQEEDVLDTWFSSALWPHSTLGWPGPALPDKPKGPSNPDWNEQKYYYPTSVLITSRDIITLWVARMVLTGLYNTGDIPFHEVYIHPKILDGYGETMSKSKGNGVDPLDIIAKFGADALRFGLAYLTTETQDVRMPVEFECPHCGKLIEQTHKNRTQPRIECTHCKKPFSTQWASKPEDTALPRGAVVSERFELARNFCNKLWNASRFALMNLEGYTAGPVERQSLTVEDQWILSRLSTVTEQVTTALEQYKFADAARQLYDFAWDEFCSFYVEMVKTRLQEPATRPVAQRILAHTLDSILRLLHPMAPFITEDVWQRLNAVAPQRGLDAWHALRAPCQGHGRRGHADADATACHAAAESVMIAPWPIADKSLVNEQIEARFARFQEVLRGLREVRARQGIAPKTTIHFSAQCDAAAAALLEPMRAYFESLAGAVPTAVGPAVTAPALSAHFTATGIEVYVDLAEHIDVAAEIDRKKKDLAKLEQLIAGKQRQLSNEAFVSRAPEAVISKERAALDELRATHASARSTLQALEAIKVQGS